MRKEVLTLIEVKALPLAQSMSFRVSQRQQRRLLWVRQQLSDYHDEPVVLLFAFVNDHGGVQLLEASDL